MARKKNSRNKGFWFWAARNQWTHTTKTGKRIAIVDENGEKITGQENEKLAEECFWQMKFAKQLGEQDEPKSDLEAIAQAYLDTQKGDRLGIAENLLQRFIKGFDSAEQITPAYVQKFLQQFNAGSTQDSRRKMIAAMFSHACKPAVGLLPPDFFNPASARAGIVIKEAEKRDYVFSDSEVKRILKNSHPAFAFFFKACLSTGARPGELATLKPEHLDDSNEVLIASLSWDEWKAGRKTKKYRTIVFSDSEIASEIQRLAANCEKGEEVFKTATGLPWIERRKKSSIRRWVSMVTNGRTAGWFPEEAVMYTARHTTITKYVRETNLSFDQLGKLFGTSAKMISDVYGHLRASDLIQIALAVAS